MARRELEAIRGEVSGRILEGEALEDERELCASAERLCTVNEDGDVTKTGLEGVLDFHLGELGDIPSLGEGCGELRCVELLGRPITIGGGGLLLTVAT